MTDRRRMRARPYWWLVVGQAVVLLPLVRILLWARGYRRTLRLLASRSPDPPAGTVSADIPDAVQEIASAVTLVARLAPFRGRCLARSITIWWLARWRGHPMEVLIGVAPRTQKGLPAHAWVEYGGIPMNDTADVRERYVVIAP